MFTVTEKANEMIKKFFEDKEDLSGDDFYLLIVLLKNRP